jgi:hypothetical protein
LLAILARVFLQGLANVVELDLTDPQSNRDYDGATSVIANLHGPASYVPNVANACAFAHGESGSTDTAASMHLSRDAVSTANNLLGVGQDRATRLHDDNFIRLNGLTPKLKRLLFVREVHHLHELSGLEVPFAQAAVIGIGTELMEVQRLDYDVSSITFFEDALVRKEQVMSPVTGISPVDFQRVDYDFDSLQTSNLRLSWEFRAILASIE